MMLGKDKKRHINRQMLWDILHHGRGRAGSAVHIALMALILLSTATIALEFVIESNRTLHILRIMESSIVACFTVDYLLRLYSAPKRLRYALSFFGIIDLLSVVPFYAGIFGSPLIRLASLIRLFKLGDIDAAAEAADRTHMQHGIELIEGEHVDYVVSKSPVYLIFGIIPALVSLIFGLGTLLIGIGPAAIALGCTLLLFATVFLWKTWLDYSYDVIYVTNYRLIFQDQHILGRSINQVHYGSITNVKPYYPHPISFILRYGSLIIDTAAEHPGQIQLNMVRRHERAAHQIMQKTFQAQRPAPTTKLTPEDRA